MTQNKLAFYYKALLFIMVGLCLIYELSSFHTEIMIGCVFLGIPVWFLKFNSLSKNKQLLMMFSFLFLGIIVFYKVVSISTCDNDAIATYIDWTVILVFSIYLTSFKFSAKDNLFLIYIIYGLIVIQLVSSIITGNSLIAGGDYDTESVRITEFGSMAMFFSSGCLLWFLHDKRVFHRLMALGGIVLSLYVIFAIQQRAINAICSVIMLLSIIIVNNKSKKTLVTFALVLLAVLLIAYFSGAYLLFMDFLIDNIKSVRISERIEDLKDFLITGDFFAHDRFSGRSDLISISLHSWLQNPLTFLFGVGDHRGNNTIIGNHSEYIDLLARYGLFGEFLYILITILFVRYLLSFCKKTPRFRSQIWIVALIFVFRNVVGIVAVYEVAIPLLLLTQSVLSIKTKEKKTKVLPRLYNSVRVNV